MSCRTLWHRGVDPIRKSFIPGRINFRLWYWFDEDWLSSRFINYLSRSCEGLELIPYLLTLVSYN